MSEGLIWIVSKHKRGSGNLNAVRGVARVLGEDMNFQTKEFELDEYLAALNLQYDIIRDSGGTTGRLSNTFGRICDHFSISPRNLQLKINWEANQSLFKTHGCPDIVMTDEMGVPFGNHIAIDSTTTGPLFPWRTYVASHMQYLGWGYYTNYAASNLVPHNLTQELLDEEAKKLKATVPAGKPVIAVVVGNPFQDTLNAFREKFARVLPKYNDAVLFISSCARTDKYDFTAFCRGIHHPDVRVFNWHADDHATNPYKGFLKGADHMIVVGESHSMVSERLYAGLSVYIYYERRGEYEASYYKFQEDGHVVNFKASTALEGLATQAFEPVDINGFVAETIKTEFLEKRLVVSPDADTNIVHDPYPDLSASQMRDTVLERGLG